MSERKILEAGRIGEDALASMGRFHAEVVHEVEEAVRTHAVVVVGMAQNPFVRKARRALSEAGVAFEYLEYGSYLSEWKKRLAIKLWSGWPTFPQVFVKGRLLGGNEQVRASLADGSLQRAIEG